MIAPELSQVLSMQRPVAFEPNRGQTIQRFKFLGRGEGFNLFIGEREVALTLDGASAGPRPRPRGAQRKRLLAEGNNDRRVIGIKLLGARATSRIEAQDQISGHINYFIGNNPQRWHTDIPIYGRVVDRGVWPGVNLEYYGNQRRIECDFIVAPRANPNAIELGFVNAGELKIDADGDLLVDSGSQKMKLLRPIVYQRNGDDRREIGGRYVLSGKSQVRFEVAAYNHEKPLVIDPAVTLAYSTYIGGSGNGSGGGGDLGLGIAVDSRGSAYVTGSTSSVNFPTRHPFQSSSKGYPNSSTVFVTKFSADGKSLVYSTYLGGSGPDQGNSIAVDSRGSAYITGTTYSFDFPTKNPLQNSLKSTIGNAFVTKFSIDGSSLIYSTYLGGSGNNFGDIGTGIVVDSGGSAYVAGWTGSSDFPTKNPFQRSLRSANNNAFVSKLSADGRALVYSTYLGGSGYHGDFGNGISVDFAGRAYIVGTTFSLDFPTKNPFQRSLKSTYNNAFIAKLSADGRSLVYSTYLGGSSYYGDFGHGIAVDSRGSAYVTGFTASLDFPTKNAFQGSLKSSSGSAFVTKFSPDGRSLMYSTFLGGHGNSALPKGAGTGIAVDSSCSAYVTGTTGSSDFPTKNAFQGSLKSAASNSFVTRFSADGRSLLYSTYLGGSGKFGDSATGVAVDSKGSAYVTGYTFSSDFPTRNPFQGSLRSANGNAFVTKLSFASPSPTPTRTPKRTPASTGTAKQTATSTRTPKRTPTLTSAIQRPPATPGEHTEQALRDWGFTAAEIAQLCSTGVAGTSSR